MRRTPAIFRRCRKHAHCKTSVQPQWHEFAEQREAHFAVLIQFWTHNLLHVSPSGATVAKKRVLRVYSSQPSLSLILDKVLRSAVAAAVPLTPTMVKLRTGTQKPFLNRCTNPAAHLAWQRVNDLPLTAFSSCAWGLANMKESKPPTAIQRVHGRKLHSTAVYRPKT